MFELNQQSLCNNSRDSDTHRRALTKRRGRVGAWKRRSVRFFNKAQPSERGWSSTATIISIHPPRGVRIAGCAVRYEFDIELAQKGAHRLLICGFRLREWNRSFARKKFSPFSSSSCVADVLTQGWKWICLQKDITTSKHPTTVVCLFDIANYSDSGNGEIMDSDPIIRWKDIVQ